WSESPAKDALVWASSLRQRCLCRIPTPLAGEPDLMDRATREEWIPELRGEGVPLPEIGSRQVHGLGRKRRERLRPRGRRLGEPLRHRMGPADGERRLDTAGETIGLDSLGGCDEDK